MQRTGSLVMTLAKTISDATIIIAVDVQCFTSRFLSQ